MKKNLFIAFEGIDGSGKSTQMRLLAERLTLEGHQVHLTCEPTEGPIGRMIRDAFNSRLKLDDKAIAGLFVADRLDHLLNEETGMIKKLKEGYTVLTDRYYLSSYAYHAPFMPMKWVIEANAMSAKLLRPDLNIYIDITAEISMSRINKSRESMELYETLDNLKLVREKYFEAFELVKDEEKIVIVDGDREQQAISDQIALLVGAL